MLGKSTFDRYFSLLSDQNKELVNEYMQSYLLIRDIDPSISDHLVYKKEGKEEGFGKMSCGWVMMDNCYCGDIVIFDNGKLGVFFEIDGDSKCLFDIECYEKEVLNEMIYQLEDNLKDCRTKRRRSIYFNKLKRV